MRCLLVAAALVVACGDNTRPPPGFGAFQAELLKLPGVHDVTRVKTQTAGYAYYVLHFEQPVDHDDPHSPTFLQEVSLLHRDIDAPMIAWTSGYWDYYQDTPVELTELLSANQISIEHRYFAGSRPDNPDWSKLTIAQMAADEHAIVTAFRTLYTGAVITSGASKGGVTAVYYR